MPIYLAEWNTSPSQQDLLNDTCFKSCYIAKNLLENMDGLDGFGYWSLTDRMGEAPLPAEMFFGGLGLFTANGIPKAAYNALTLLAKLGNQLISRGDGRFLTQNERGFQAILYLTSGCVWGAWNWKLRKKWKACGCTRRRTSANIPRRQNTTP